MGGKNLDIPPRKTDQFRLKGFRDIPVIVPGVDAEEITKDPESADEYPACDDG